MAAKKPSDDKPPEAQPERATPEVVEPEVTPSPALSLFAHPAGGSIRARRIAILVADGVDGAAAQALEQLVLQSLEDEIGGVKAHHTKGWCRERWAKPLGLAAVLPPEDLRTSRPPSALHAPNRWQKPCARRPP